MIKLFREDKEVLLRYVATTVTISKKVEPTLKAKSGKCVFSLFSWTLWF